MSEEQTLYVRGNDDLGTPNWILERIRCMGPIGLDPCSNPWSLVRARVEWSLHAGHDSLAVSAAEWANVAGNGLIFMNPPYSNPKPWCTKIAEATSIHMAEGIALLKLDPSTAWSAIVRNHRSARCDLHKRVSFEGGKHKTGALASTLAYFGSRPHLFCHFFQDVGEVQAYR